MHYFATYETGLIGELTLIANDDGLAGVFMEQTRHIEKLKPKEMKPDSKHPHIKRAVNWLGRYFAGEKPTTGELDLAPEGTEFRKRVWRILAEIPYGKTTTYGAIAERLAKDMGKAKMSAQAVGGAVGHNPIGIIVPCHRVVGTNKSLIGYGGGMSRKIALLELEGIDMSELTVPTKGTAL